MSANAGGSRKVVLDAAKKLGISVKTPETSTKAASPNHIVDDNENEALIDVQQYIVTAIANPNNDVIANTSLSQIEETKRNILEDAGFTKASRAALQKSLREYRYIDELNELREGCYTRWICLDKMQLSAKGHLQPKLTIGGILCEIKLHDAGVSLVCKNKGRMFQFGMETSLVFQKLTGQESVILYALEVLGGLGGSAPQ